MIVREELLNLAKPEIKQGLMSFYFGVGNHYKIQIWKGHEDSQYGEMVMAGDAVMFTVQQIQATIHLYFAGEIYDVKDWFLQNNPNLKLAIVHKPNFDILVIMKKDEEAV